MFVRYASAIASGTFMTFALLFVMQSLIGLQPGAISDPGPYRPINLGTVLKPTPPQAKPPKLIRPEDLTHAPIPPRLRRSTGGGTIVGVPMTGPRVPKPDFTLTQLEQVDGPLVAIVRVKPVYPTRASVDGREGYVVVQFDVTASGRVENVAVIESSHPVFENSALKAAQRFKFRARVVDGVPQASVGIQNVFRFEMEQQ